MRLDDGAEFWGRKEPLRPDVLHGARLRTLYPAASKLATDSLSLKAAIDISAEQSEDVENAEEEEL